MKIRDTVADIAETLDIPPEAASGVVKVTLLGRKRAVVEHHRGLLGYTEELVEVNAGTDRVRIIGSQLRLRAMDAETLLVTGQVSAVEYG